MVVQVPVSKTLISIWISFWNSFHWNGKEKATLRVLSICAWPHQCCEFLQPVQVIERHWYPQVSDPRLNKGDVSRIRRPNQRDVPLQSLSPPLGRRSLHLPA